MGRNTSGTHFALDLDLGGWDDEQLACQRQHLRHSHCRRSITAIIAISQKSAQPGAWCVVSPPGKILRTDAVADRTSRAARYCAMTSIRTCTAITSSAILNASTIYLVVESGRSRVDRSSILVHHPAPPGTLPHQHLAGIVRHSDERCGRIAGQH